MSFDRAVEIAEQTHHQTAGYLINDLVLHYGCEIVYKLKSFNKLVIVDFPLTGPPKNIINSLQILLAGGADLVSLDHSIKYTPPTKYLEKCILSIVHTKVTKELATSYSNILCKKSQLPLITQAKLFAIGDQNCDTDFVVKNWWSFLEKHRLVDKPN